MHVLDSYGFTNELKTLLSGLKVVEIGNFEAYWRKIEDICFLEKSQLPPGDQDSDAWERQLVDDNVRLPQDPDTGIFRKDNRTFKLVVNSFFEWSTSSDDMDIVRVGEDAQKKIMLVCFS